MPPTLSVLSAGRADCRALRSDVTDSCRKAGELSGPGQKLRVGHAAGLAADDATR
jgi:hypothetical protein